MTVVNELRLVEADHDDMAGRILDAAREQFELFGIRRTTMDDVARRAKVSRVTIYRRFPKKDDLVRATIMRETQLLFDAVDAAVESLPNAADQLVEGFVQIMKAGRKHPMLHRLLEIEPESVLNLFTLDAGPIISFARAYLADHVRRGQDAGQLRYVDADAIAEIAVRLTVSFVLTPDSYFKLHTDQDLREFARRYLIPVLVAEQPKRSLKT